MGQRKVTDYLMCIDPGTKYLGWSIFEICSNRSAKLIASGALVISAKNNDWIKRIDLICSELLKVCEKHFYCEFCTIRFLIELPRNFGSCKGQAASNSGSVGKLMGCVFQIKGTLQSEFMHSVVELIPVNQWKGNIPKHITEQRIQKYWGKSGKTSDESDAIGIGDYWIRKVLKYKPTKVKGD